MKNLSAQAARKIAEVQKAVFGKRLAKLVGNLTRRQAGHPGLSRRRSSPLEHSEEKLRQMLGGGALGGAGETEDRS